MLSRIRTTAALPSLLGVLLYVLAFVGEITAGAHESAVPHARCAEHGQLLHVARSGELPGRADFGPARATGSGRVEGHEHCSLAAVADQAARSSVGPLSSQVVAVVLPAVRITALAVHASTDGLLRLAPKTSPPRA